MPSPTDFVEETLKTMGSSKGAVLIVDDDLGPRESMQMILESDYTVYSARSVTEALELLTRVSLDCVIMDIKMPERDGLEGLLEIRKINTSVSVIMCTAHACLETAQQAIRLRANDYIRKPFSSKELLDVVEDQVARSRLRQAHEEAVREVKSIESKLAGELSELGMAASALVHDLRNPLTTLLGSVYLLEEEVRTLDAGLDPERSESVQEYLKIINKNLLDCRRLTTSWKSMADTQSMKWDRFDVSEVVEQIAFNPPKDGQNVTRVVQCIAPEIPVEVTADKNQFHRMLTNLVLNAVQATDPDRGLIKLRWATVDAHLVLSVADNGVGIRPESLQRIMEPFYTQDKEDGSGLGLFIVKRIVSLHQGTLHVESTLGEGATFIVKIPLMKTGASSAAS